MGTINTVPVAFNTRGQPASPTTKLATFLFKEKRLSQASLELSSSRGVFGSLENERKRREKREKPNPKMKATGFLLKCQNYFKSPLLVTKWGGGGGGLI